MPRFGAFFTFSEWLQRAIVSLVEPAFLAEESTYGSIELNLKGGSQAKMAMQSE
jgi:hypothetical protein